MTIARRASRTPFRRDGIAALMFSALAMSPPAFAAAGCELLQDDTLWNLVCAADDAHQADDDYQCDYVIELTHANSPADQQDASGALEPGQNNAVIWSSSVYGGADIASASIVSGSCSR